jgi:hypothetical protein
VISPGYRIRLRVRLGKALTSDATSIALICDGRPVELKSQNPDEPLKKAKWVVFVAKGFETEEAARSFGERLRAQVELAALSSRLGVDTGENQPTSWLSEEWARSQGLIGEGEHIFPNVHGLLIVPDNENSKVFILEGQATVSADPGQLIAAVEELSHAGLTDLGNCTIGVRLLNFALMSSEALARAVLAFAAVEALGQDEMWSDRQRRRLEELASEVDIEAAGKDSELREISEALRRSLHRIGLRQGVLRVLQRLDLNCLKKDWDRLYTVRSGIFHGTRNFSRHELEAFGNDALSLCARIVMKDVQTKGHHIPEVFSKHFGAI